MIDFTFNIDNSIKYPEAPFHPDSDYPEFSGVFQHFDNLNLVYKSVRNLFIMAGYDKENIGNNKWNPFRGYIADGQRVVIKPNLVYEETGELLGKKCLTTNASLIRPIIDYLFLLQKQDHINFKIIVGDVPIQGADFEKILIQTGLKAVYDFYNANYPEVFQIKDLRHKIAITDSSGFYKTITAEGDPMGYSKIHLENSFLNEISKDYKKFGSPGYGFQETYSQIDSTGNHYYHIPNTILFSDLFINLPKLKTHKKAGITLAMKNLIGINGEKAWIPHFRRGSLDKGGDEFDDKQVWLKYLTTRTSIILQGKSRLLWNFAKKINKLIFKRYFRADFKNRNGNVNKSLFLLDGNWYGNDTLWRSILDLNYLLFYIDRNLKVTSEKVRKYICLTDGIIAGEGDGPLDPFPKYAGTIALCENPVINDVCISRIMGYDWSKIPQLKNSVELFKFFNFNGDTKKIKIAYSDHDHAFYAVDFNNLPNLKFIAPPGWLGHIEI
jgi:uncharacterized protein (DUF362 family)